MSDSIEFREATRADRDAILALRAVAFPGEDIEKQLPRFWEWEFAEGYAGQGRIFVAEAEHRLVGHFAFVPQRYERNRAPVNGALAVDVMTHPDFRRRKVFSRLSSLAAAKLQKDFEMILAFQIRQKVRAGMEAGGWRAAATVPIHVQPLSLRGMVRDFGFRFAAPDPGSSPPLPRGLVRNLDDDYFDDVRTLVETAQPHQPRSAAFLRWRYRANPSWKYNLLGYVDRGELQAFLVCRDAVLRGMQSLAIVDAGFRGTSDDSLRHLIAHVCRDARTRGLSLAAAFFSVAHPACGAIKRAGFFRGPYRFQVMTQIFDESLRDALDVPLSLSWGDTDHL